MTGPPPPPVGPGPASGAFSRLLHLGNVVVDLVLTVPALPERGGDVLASGTRLAAGGGFNVLAAAARQGLPAAYAGGHGTGPFASLARAALGREGIEVLLPANRGLDTGFVVAVVEPGGERTFLTSPGAEATLTAADLRAVTPTAGDAVYLSGYGLAHPANRAALLPWLAGLPRRAAVVLDPGPLAGSVPAAALDPVLARTTWLTCNAAEAVRLTGAADPRQAARRLTRRAPAARVLVRLGADGCLLAGPGSEPVHVPGFTVTAVDTSGAGDTHTGVFLAALARGQAPVPAVRLANAAAAWSVTRPGPATGPTRAELAGFLAAASPDGGPRGGGQGRRR
jgi:sugar/nucleoside kinase (ribokinase family)